MRPNTPWHYKLKTLASTMQLNGLGTLSYQHYKLTLPTCAGIQSNKERQNEFAVKSYFYFQLTYLCLSAIASGWKSSCHSTTDFSWMSSLLASCIEDLQQTQSNISFTNTIQVYWLYMIIWSADQGLSGISFEVCRKMQAHGFHWWSFPVPCSCNYS